MRWCLWRLKTEYCIIRWLCKGSAVSSYCHTNDGWLNEGQEWWHRSRAEQQRRVYPLASGRDKGQWLWVHREKIYKHLATQLFSMPIQLSLPFIHCHYKPHFALNTGIRKRETLRLSSQCSSVCLTVHHYRRTQREFGAKRQRLTIFVLFLALGLGQVTQLLQIFMCLNADL